MADQGIIWKAIDKRVRSSLIYSEWVKRHRSVACTSEGCTEKENLEVHHVVDLYHVILGVWKLYGEPEATIQHVLMYHENDMLEGVCLCPACHKKRHPLRPTDSFGPVNTDTWCVIPRMLQVNPNHSTHHRPDAIGLIAYQTLLGIGWNIINGYVEARMLSLHRRRFAELIGKKPSVSFNRSLDVALRQLQAAGILDAHHRRGNEIELHLARKYLDLMSENPWFVPLTDVKTDSMCVLCLRLWLGMQCRRHNYYIGLDKLKGHIGMTVQERSAALAAIRRALKSITWAKMTIGKESLQFVLGSRLPTPIRALRTILADSIREAL